MRELIQRKDDLVAQKATPPYYLNVNNFVALCIDSDEKALNLSFSTFIYYFIPATEAYFLAPRHSNLLFIQLCGRLQ